MSNSHVDSTSAMYDVLKVDDPPLPPVPIVRAVRGRQDDYVDANSLEVSEPIHPGEYGVTGANVYATILDPWDSNRPQFCGSGHGVRPPRVKPLALYDIAPTQAVREDALGYSESQKDHHVVVTLRDDFPEVPSPISPLTPRRISLL